MRSYHDRHVRSYADNRERLGRLWAIRAVGGPSNATRFVPDTRARRLKVVIDSTAYPGRPSGKSPARRCLDVPVRRPQILSYNRADGKRRDVWRSVALPNCSHQ